MGDETLKQFIVILKHLILNLRVRFFNISFSLDKRVVKKYLDYENVMIRPEAPVWNCSRCGVAPFLELFNIRRCPVDTQIARKFVDLGVEQEWPGLVRLVLSEREILRRQVKEEMA